jgi:hypothetical protein
MNRGAAMKFLKKALLILAASMGGAGTSLAAVVYDESVSGDLSNTPSTLLALSEGSNTIFGSAIFASGGLRDLDSFLFLLGPGQYAVGGFYEVLDRSMAANTTQLRSHYDLYDSSLNLLGGYNADVLLDGGESIFGMLPGGLYGVNNAWMDRSGGGGSWDYVITITVANVPEPESLALAGAGLLIMAISRARRRR